MRLDLATGSLELDVSTDTHGEVVRSAAANVVTSPEDEFRFDGRVEVEGRAKEMATVVMFFDTWIVEFVGKSHGELLVQIHGRFDVEHAFVFGERLVDDRRILVGEESLVVRTCEVEELVVEGRFYEEGVDSVTLIRVSSPGRVDAIAKVVRALCVLDFCTEGISVRTADFLAEYPVEARGNRKAFVRFRNQIETVGDEGGKRMGVVFGGTDISLAVFHFESDTANALVTENDCVIFGIAPVVIREGACVISQIAEHDARERGELPSESHAVKIKSGPTVFGIAHRRRTVFVANLGGFGTVFRNVIAVGATVDAHGDVFIQEDFAFELDVLVCGVGRAKILVPIRSVIGIDFAVQFYIDSHGGSCCGENKKAKVLDHSFLCVKTRLGFKIEICAERIHQVGAAFL